MLGDTEDDKQGLQQQQQQQQSTEAEASPYCQCGFCDDQLKKVELVEINSKQGQQQQQQLALVDMIGHEEAAWCYSWRQHWWHDLAAEAEGEGEAEEAEDFDLTAQLEADQQKQQQQQLESEDKVHLPITTSADPLLFQPLFPADFGEEAFWNSFGSSSWRQLWWPFSRDEKTENSAAAEEEMPPESSSSSDDQQQQLLLTTTTTTTEGEAEPQLSKRGQLVAADLAALRQLLTAHSTAFARQLEADLEHLEQSVIDPLVERTEQRTTALLASAHRSLAETAERWRAGGRQLKSSLEEGAEAVGDSLQQAAQAVATLCSGTLAPALKKLATEAAAVAGEAATVVTEIGGSLESAASSSASESASVEFSFSSSGGPGEQQQFTEDDLYEANRSGPLKRLVAWLVTKFGPTEQSTRSAKDGSLAEWPRSSGLSESLPPLL